MQNSGSSLRITKPGPPLRLFENAKGGGFCRRFRGLPSNYPSLLSLKSWWETQTHTMTIIIHCVLNSSRHKKVHDHGEGATARCRSLGGSK